MPVAKLFVEGKLDIALLTPVLSAGLDAPPALVEGGSKDSLKPRTRTERQESRGRVDARYLRDRDFDYDPPEDLVRPTEDARQGEVILGWRWSRHEIESYLLEPRLVGSATGWSVAEVEDALRAGAREIRSYQAARWLVGVVRRDWPPHFQLRTRPEDLRDLNLPTQRDADSTRDWAFEQIRHHRGRIDESTAETRLREVIDTFAERFDDAFLEDTSQILLWFSGKDLLAALGPWLREKTGQHPGDLRADLRDWVIDHPAAALELLEEWRGLVDLLSS